MSGLSEAQLAIRRTGITGSDIRALFDLDPFGRTEHDVYAEKAGLPAPPGREPEWLSLGLELEPILVRRLAVKCRLYELAVPRDEMTVVHPECAHHIATPDAFFGDTLRVIALDPREQAVALGEVKVVSPFFAHEWGQEGENVVPDWVRVQCVWEMHVTGKERVHVGALLWPGIRTYTVRRDSELEGQIVEGVDRFWTDHVKARRPPALDGSAGSGRMVKRLFPRPTGPVVKAAPADEALARAYFKAKRVREMAEMQFDQCQQRLQARCGEFAGIDGDGWRLRWQTRPGREVTPEPYTIPPYRHWDIREKKAGKRR